jgi:hypothetical protein
VISQPLDESINATVALADFASADLDAMKQLIKTDDERFEANEQLFAYRRDLRRATLLVPVMHLDAEREEFLQWAYL